MNRIHKVTISFILGCAATVLGQNLLTNPGFESQGSGWTLFSQAGSPAMATVTYPTIDAHGGSRYARIDVTVPAASASENWHIQFQPSAWTAGIGATYEFKFWAKSDSGSNIHVSVQGSDYTYLTGMSFGLTPEWTEYSLTYLSEAEGSGAVRFHVYVAESKDVYGFDDFSVTALTAGVRRSSSQGQALRIHREAGNLTVSMGESLSGGWKVELSDLRGVSLASATGQANHAVHLALPEKSGIYFIRASTLTRSWVRKVSIQ